MNQITEFSNYFIVVVLCMGLRLVLTQFHLKICNTIYIKNGSKSVDIPCSSVIGNATAKKWHINKETTEEIRCSRTKRTDKIVCCDPLTAKCDIRGPVTSSLVIENIKISDTGYYSCRTSRGYDYVEDTTLLLVVVPPKSDAKPILMRRTFPQEDLTGPYLENVDENFTCYIRNVLPGKDSTSFSFYYNYKLRLQSNNGTGEVVEKDEGDGTKYVEWKFTTKFDRGDNGGNFRCTVDWQAGSFEELGIRSDLTEHTKVIFKSAQVKEDKTNSDNPASLMDMDSAIGTTKQSHIIPKAADTPGSAKDGRRVYPAIIAALCVVIFIIIVVAVLYNKSRKSSQESDQRVNSVQGLQMTEGVDTTNAAGVYTTTGRNSYANAEYANLPPHGEPEYWDAIILPHRETVHGDT